MINRSMCGAVMAAAIAMGTIAATAPASAIETAPNSQVQTSAQIKTDVGMRGRGGYGRGHYGWGRHRGHGRGIGLGIAGAIIGGAIIANEADREGYYADGGGDGAAQCAAQFRSFNPSTGTYTTYDGQTVLCPYLR